jgi:hypothetical protein
MLGRRAGRNGPGGKRSGPDAVPVTDHGSQDSGASEKREPSGKAGSRETSGEFETGKTRKNARRVNSQSASRQGRQGREGVSTQPNRKDTEAQRFDR